MTTNRHERRAAAKASRSQQHHHHDEPCPGCDSVAVIRHMARNAEVMKNADGQPVFFPIGEGEPPPGLADFGIMQVAIDPANEAIAVRSFGREVFRMSPGKVECDEPGAWRHTLHAIASDLDARFGHVPGPPHNHDRGIADEPVQCAGPDFEEAAREAIAQHGQFMMTVFSDTEEDPWWFSYTIGNHEHGLPELLMIYPGGKANAEQCAGILNRAGELQRLRSKAFEHGELVTLQDGRPPVRLIDATERATADHTHGVGRYYGTDNYQVRQLLFPDKAGRYPGDPRCAEPYAGIPVLGPVLQ